MSVIIDVIREEENRLNELIQQYDKKIAQYPKGSISVKKRGSRLYCYRVYRDENNKVKYIYLGKNGATEVEECSRKIEDRRRYELRKKQSKESLKEIRKLLNVAAR